MAEASVQVLNESKAMSAQQQAQQNQQDPVLQMQMQELQIKQGELQIKQQEAALKQKKITIDAAAKADELKLKETEIKSREAIAGLNAQVRVAQEDKSRANQEKEFAVKTGVDMAHKRALLLKDNKTKG